MDELGLRDRLVWTIQALYSSQQTLLASIAKINAHLEFGSLRSAVNRHAHDSRLQLKRLACISQMLSIDVATPELFSAPDDLAMVAADLAAGITYGDVTGWVLPSLYHMTIVEHGLFIYARSACQLLGEFEAAALFLAGEEEVEHFGDVLQSYTVRRSERAELQVA